MKEQMSEITRKRINEIHEAMKGKGAKNWSAETLRRRAVSLHPGPEAFTVRLINKVRYAYFKLGKVIHTPEEAEKVKLPRGPTLNWLGPLLSASESPVPEASLPEVRKATSAVPADLEVLLREVSQRMALYNFSSLSLTRGEKTSVVLTETKTLFTELT